MDARTLQRIGLSVLVAALATVLPSGCTPLRGVRPDPFTPAPASPVPGGGVVPADAIAGGTVVSAGGAAQPAAAVVPAAQPPVAPMPDPLALPRPLPPAVPVADPLMAPPVPPGSKFAYPAPADPHVLTRPTATGARLALQPHEMSTDRVVELSLHLERLIKHNDVLAARIKELEAAGGGREQALEEAARAIAAGSAEAERTRAALQAQVVRLQGKVKELEEEDIVFLRAVIEALGKLAPPEKKP